MVPGYEPFARALFDDAGVDVEFRLADLVADPSGAEPADLVVLNQVVCCTPDGPALVGSAAGLTRVALAFTYPRDRPSFRFLAGSPEPLVLGCAGGASGSSSTPAPRSSARPRPAGCDSSTRVVGFAWATADFERG